MKIIEEELGSPVESFFSYISEEPVAAASFGQVGLYLDAIGGLNKYSCDNCTLICTYNFFVL